MQAEALNLAFPDIKFIFSKPETLRMPPSRPRPPIPQNGHITRFPTMVARDSTVGTTAPTGKTFRFWPSVMEPPALSTAGGSRVPEGYRTMGGGLKS